MSDAVLYGFVRLVANASLLAMLALLARTLGPGGVGEYTLVLNAAWFVGMVWFGWCGHAAFRYSVQYQREGSLDEMRGNLARIQALLGAAIVVPCLIVVLLAGPWEWTVVGIVASIILLATSGPAQSNLELLRIDGRARAFAAASLTLSLLPLTTIALAFLLFTPSLEGALALQALITSAVFAGFAFAWMKRGRSGTRQLTTHGRTFWRYGWPLIGGGALTWVLAVADRYLLGVFEGTAGVGIYTAGYQIGTAPMWFLYMAVMMPLEPLIFGAHEANDQHRAGEHLGKAFALITALGALLLIILTAERDFLVRLVVGSRFEDAASVIPLTALGCLFLSLGTVMQQRFVLTDDTKPIAQGLLAAAVLNIAINATFIPRFSILAAAGATAMGYLVYLIFLGVRGTSRYTISIPYRWLGAIPLSGMAAAGSVALVRMADSSQPAVNILEMFVMVAAFASVFMFSAGVEFRHFIVRLFRTSGSTT